MGLIPSITHPDTYADMGIRNIARRAYFEGHEDPTALGEHPFLVSSCTTKLTFSAPSSSVSPGEVINGHTTLQFFCIFLECSYIGNLLSPIHPSTLLRKLTVFSEIFNSTYQYKAKSCLHCLRSSSRRQRLRLCLALATRGLGRLTITLQKKTTTKISSTQIKYLLLNPVMLVGIHYSQRRLRLSMLSK